MKIKELWGRLRESVLPSENNQKEKAKPGFRPKAHPTEEITRPETYEGHGMFTRRYRYMTLGPNRKERRGMAKRVKDWDRKKPHIMSAEQEKYDIAMKYAEWVLLNAPANIPAKGHWSTMDGKKVFIPYVPNNPMYGVTA